MQADAGLISDVEMNFINQVWDQLIGQLLSGYDRVCVTPLHSPTSHYLIMCALEQHQYHISLQILDLGRNGLTDWH